MKEQAENNWERANFKHSHNFFKYHPNIANFLYPR